MTATKQKNYINNIKMKRAYCITHFRTKFSPKNMAVMMVFILVVLSSCKDKWEDHNALKHNVLAESLDHLIAGNSALSVFAGYLKETGYDKVLESSKTFTVWAPDNDALNNLDPGIVNDTVKLKQFVKNHITYQEYPTNLGGISVRIKMLSGKNIAYVSGQNQIEGAEIDLTRSNQYCLNGILHVIKTPLMPKNSLWEYFTSLTDTSMLMQKNYVQTVLITKVFDPGLSRQTGFNVHGQPVYDSVWIYKNAFLSYVNDVSNEDSVYTFFILKNDASLKEYNKLLPFVNDTTIHAAILKDYYAKWNVYKDIVVRGKYTKDNLPANLVSTRGIVIPTANITIESQFEASNGTVFVVSNFDIPKENKIPAVIIEGENYWSTYDNFFLEQHISLLGIRSRSWASGGKDLFIPGYSTGPSIPNLSVLYWTPSLYSLPYKVYWRAVNDFQSGNFTQKLAINADSIKAVQATTYHGDTLVNFKTIVPNNYSEVLLGQTTIRQYGQIRLFVAANATITNNPIVLDYIKLIPVFQ
jgi:uncharacterized surface protein with fasciclin (FAS1) repeats